MYVSRTLRVQITKTQCHVNEMKVNIDESNYKMKWDSSVIVAVSSDKLRRTMNFDCGVISSERAIMRKKLV